MTRHCKDWLASFLDYSRFGEAPTHMYFWAGVSAVAGALRRKVWIDQAYFRWYPNFYICFVAPPGIVQKSTTSGIAMNLLREVEGVKFGPDIVTWQALVSSFAEATEGFETADGLTHIMSAITLESSEFGNLLDPKDTQMVDLLVSLWDGKQGSMKKSTKGNGTDIVENPWINLIACTTPGWIAGSFPEYMIGGGFTSRMLFIYADKKRQFVAYPGLSVPKDLKQQADKLVEDLRQISTLTGEYRLTPEAVAWGEAWYLRHYQVRPVNLDMERFGGYFARKQTHIHKLAMILAASSTDELIISKEHLEVADSMVTDLEPDMQLVFSKIGRSDMANSSERLVSFVHQRGKVEYEEAYRHVHSAFPFNRDFNDMVTGCVRAGYLILKQENQKAYLLAGKPLPTSAEPKRQNNKNDVQSVIKL